MDKVKIGFVGTGTMGQMAHLRNYSVLKECEVVCLAEAREGLGRDVAARYGVQRVYRDHQEMLDKEKLDGIIASQPFDRHALLLPELFGRVPCVFTEKPITVSVSAGETLRQLAEKTKTIHMVGYHKRCDPATVYAKKVIDELKTDGRLGKMKYIRILMPSGDWIANGTDGMVHASKSETYPAPSGVKDVPDHFTGDTAKEYVSFVNYYIHQINLLRFLLGESYKITHASKSGVLLTAEAASGVDAVIEMTPFRSTVDWQEEAMVAFENGFVKLSLPAPLTVNRPGSVELFEDRGSGATPFKMAPVLPMVHAMKAQAEAFLAVCRGERKPPCDGAEAVEDLKMAEDYIRLRFGK